MHATTEQLLSLRDGQPVAAGTAAHVAGCESCRGQLQSLERMRSRLRALPALDPPQDLWRTVAVNAVSKRARPASRGPFLFAAAASLALGALLILHTAQQPDKGPVPGTTTDLIASTPAPPSSVNGATRAELLATSRALEAALRALPAAPRVTRASTAVTIAELQDRIYEIDVLLSDPQMNPAEERALWQQRVTLMDALMQIRYAQLSEAR
jgi:hypothetical protein